MVDKEQEKEKLKNFINRSQEKFVYQQLPGSQVFFKVPIDRKKATVVVLGDIGRSPRMCYHAHSLATVLNYDVTLVGYFDSKPHSKIAENVHITIQPITAPPAINFGSEWLQMLLKLVWTFGVLLFTLLFRTSWSCDLVLMQNPPAIPTAPVCWLVARLKGAVFIIDWHNYMYSILRDKYGFQHTSFDPAPEPVAEQIDSTSTVKDSGKKRREDRKVTSAPTTKKKEKTDKKDTPRSFRLRFVEWIYHLERWFGRRADGGLCVTKAMQKDLLSNWKIPSAVFYDRPPSWTFGNTTEKDKHELFMRLGSEYPVFGADHMADSNKFTEMRGGKVHWKEDRPMIVMSSTSWTLDEDFSILLEAILKYNEIAHIDIRSAASKRLPSLLLVITGKGPTKAHYLEKIARLNMDKVKVITPWLEATDYPKMLAAADIGVSLHTSTSGLDLPMKVVDMFGSGIPVLAKNFACIGELVVDKKNGYLFDSFKDLQEQLMLLATGFPNHCQDLLALKENVRTEKLETWEETWPTTVASVVTPPENHALLRTLASEPDDSDSD